MAGGLILSLYLAFSTLWQFEANVGIEGVELLTQNVHNRREVVSESGSFIREMQSLDQRNKNEQIQSSSHQHEHVNTLVVELECSSGLLHSSSKVRSSNKMATYGRFGQSPKKGILNDDYCDCPYGSSGEILNLYYQSSNSITARSVNSVSIKDHGNGKPRKVRGSQMLRGHGQSSASGPSTVSAEVRELHRSMHYNSDEPMTSACSFYLPASPAFKCKPDNTGIVKFLFASRVRDGVCDCCGGEDENMEGEEPICTNTCASAREVLSASQNGRSPQIKASSSTSNRGNRGGKRYRGRSERGF